MSAELTIFVCSTFADLVDERKAVLDAIRRLQLQHDSMEYFGARPNAALETCIDEVRRSDALLVIVGHRYGTIATSRGISFSQAEYEEGYAIGKPCLVYFRDDNVPVLPRYVEGDSGRSLLLESWKATLSARHTVATFRDSNDLALQVAADIARTLEALKSNRDKARTVAANEDQFWRVAKAILQDVREESVSDEEILNGLKRLSSGLTRRSRAHASILLSYNRGDADVAFALSDALTVAAADSNLSITFKEVDWSQDDPVYQLAVLLDTVPLDFVIVLLSSYALESDWATGELDLLASLRISADKMPTVIPLVLDDIDVTKVPPLLRDTKWLHTTTKTTDSSARELLDVIRRSLRQKPGMPRSAG